MSTVSIGCGVSSRAQVRCFWRRTRRGAALCAGVLGFLVSRSSWAAPLQVTSLADAVVNDSACTLREAITAVNTGANFNGCLYSGQSQINIPAGTITLSSTLPAVTASVYFRGAGHASTIINGGSNFGIGRWVLNGAFGVGLSDLTLRNFSNGGPWVNSGTSANLSYVKIENSGSATAQGGCLMVQGTASVVYSQFEGCRGHTGAAIRVNGGWLNMTSSTVLKSRGEHGIITADLDAFAAISTSTIASNRVGAASGVAGEGAIYATGTSNVNVWNSTIAYNTKEVATASGGGTSLFEGASADLFISGSVVYSNQTGASDCVGGITADHSVFASSKGCPTTGTNFVNNSPQLQPLTTSETSPDGLVFTNLPRAAGGVGRVYVPSSSSSLDGLLDRDDCSVLDQRGIARQDDCTAGAVYRGIAGLVVGNQQNLSVGDTALRTQLENLGYIVPTYKDTDVTAASISPSVDVVVISESVTSANVNTKLRSLTAGVVVLEPWLLDDMSMTTAANLGTTSQTQTYLVEGGAASAVGTLGLVTTTTSSKAHGWGIAQVGSNAQVQAYSSASSNQQSFFYYPAFSPMVGGFAPPHPRVGVFITDDAASALSATGVRLFQEAVIRAAEYDSI